jgi:ubiquinone/menaquinone biosynthesis C-methylase UbiE
MLMNPFKKRSESHMLVVGMAGVKLGDRFAQLGCANGGRMAAVARQVGLSGHAVAVVPDDASAARARKGAADEGVLVEVEVAPLNSVPLPDAGLDLVIIDETDGMLASMTMGDRDAAVREAARVLRPGGRVMVIAGGTRSGMSGLFARSRPGPPIDINAALAGSGFRSVRTLAEREGLIFLEGVKPR